MTAVAFRRFLASRRAVGCPTEALTWLQGSYDRFQAFRGRRAITPALCRAYLSHLRQGGLPAAEVRGAWRGARIYLRWMVEQGALDEAVLLPGPPPELTYREALTAEDIERIVIAAPDQRSALLVWAFWTTGLRSEKLRALRWADLDFAAHGLRTRDAAGQQVELALPVSLAEPLQAWRSRSTSPWVFGVASSPPTAAEVQQLIRLAGERAGYPHLAPGQLQYAWLRQYFRSGGPRSSAELQARLAQPFRIRGFSIPNLTTFEELRRAHAQHSPLEAALRPQKPSRPSLRRTR